MRSIIKPFLRLLSELLIISKKFLWKLNFSRIHRIEVLPGVTFKLLHYGDVTQILYVQQHLVRYGKSFESTTLNLYRELIQEDFTILDIGANIGLFSLLGSASIGLKGKIFAFEPNRKTFEVLKKNLEINNIKNVEAFNLALSNSSGKVMLTIPSKVRTTFDYGDAYFALDYSNDHENSKMEDDSWVNSVSLDDFISKHSIIKVDLIKIDIEGAEILCFQGANDLFRSPMPPIIIMECTENLCNKFNVKVFDVLLYLSKFGYSSTQYTFDGQWIAIPKRYNSTLNSIINKYI